MSTYTAPQRTSRKRSFSRRTKILLSASTLIPLSLFAIASTPAGAAAKFATLQDIHDAINTALAPIQSAIASLQQQQNDQQTAITNLQNTQTTHTSQISDLQTQQQNQAQQISNLQNSTNKQLKTYDANGQLLGLTINQSTIYSLTLQRFIYFAFNDASSIDGDFSAVATDNTAYYQSSDCTGTPYSLASSANLNSYTSDLIPVSPQAFFIIPDSETPTTVSINSALQWGFYTHQATCRLVPMPNTQTYQLQQVNLPFTVPLALPLQFKYQ